MRRTCAALRRGSKVLTVAGAAAGRISAQQLNPETRRRPHRHLCMLQQRDGAQAAVGTYADNRAAALRQGRKFFDGLTQNARAGGAKGMAKGNTAAERSKSPRGLTSDQEAAEASDAPKILEQVGREFAKFDLLIVSGVIDDKIGWAHAITRGHRAVEQPAYVALDRCVGHNRLGTAAGRRDRLYDLFDLVGAPAGDEDMVAFGREAPAQRRAKPAFGAHADDDGGRLAHDAAPTRQPSSNSASSPLSCISRTISQPPTKLPFT